MRRFPALVLGLPLSAACGVPEPTVAVIEPPDVEPLSTTAAPPPVDADSSKQLTAFLPQEPPPEGTRSSDDAPGSESPERLATPPRTSHLTLDEAVVARRAGRSGPSGIAATFDEGSEVHCYTRVTAAAGGTSIVHRWYEGDRLKTTVPLRVSGRAFRTWSRVRVYGRGPWRVEIADADGVVLGSVRFEVR